MCTCSRLNEICHSEDCADVGAAHAQVKQAPTRTEDFPRRHTECSFFSLLFIWVSERSQDVPLLMVIGSIHSVYCKAHKYWQQNTGVLQVGKSEAVARVFIRFYNTKFLHPVKYFVYFILYGKMGSSFGHQRHHPIVYIKFDSK